MLRFHPLSLAMASVLASGILLSGCGGSSSSSPRGPQVDLSDLDPAQAAYCDQMINSHCLYPFPNNYFTVSDSGTPTRLRVNFQPEAMPIAQPLGAMLPGLSTEPGPVQPAEWNRNDGFSPGAMLLAHFPGLDLAQTGAATLSDLSASLADDAPILVIDADTGERHLIWAELDATATDPERQSLMIRPATNFIEGHRYIVALRNLRNSEGDLIEPSPLFRAYRDTLRTGEAVYENRRAAMEDIFSRLAQHNVNRSELTLAWDFTVASQQNITGRLLQIRDDAFARLGGNAPAFTVTSFSEEIDGQKRTKFSRGIVGTFKVPNYLTTPGGVPGGSFNYGSDDPDALPEVRNGDDMVDARFRCQVSEATVADFDEPTSIVTPARPALYGHGLFGEGPGGEFRSNALWDMSFDHNIMYCATDWIGMSRFDVEAGIVPLVLSDISNLPMMNDRSQQGILNFMYLAELLRHEDGFASHPAFQHNGNVVFQTGLDEVFYDGNSQGGIIGGALVATAPNVHRGVLGVPGANYSLLLQRFGPFAERFGVIFYPAYPDKLDQSLVFALMQMLWDRAENNGYLSHFAGRYLPNTEQDKRILLHGALGDHLVTQWSPEIIARTIGAAMHEPTRRLGDHNDANPYYGIADIEQYPYEGHALMVWDSGAYDPVSDRGNALPPVGNIGPNEDEHGHDPHESPRRTPAAQAQKSAFMQRDSQVTDVCGNDICRSFDHTGLAR
ncbi:hypothetical protein A167_00252 [Alcanivorax sp. S71-1-4]|uniref:hypothetical protein n=1 Tax=Alcanivorax sp. S71-1-4 TaxID=1177159 RepID=UPI001359FA82|nr:hypothetical protein [Alcanivorax sp. S71-1-4]KAF0811220.1 hypothetical protein A167_00252 [Alcanivorax sp. S71-1-4]